MQIADGWDSLVNGVEDGEGVKDDEFLLLQEGPISMRVRI
jgi:hypothetical protein